MALKPQLAISIVKDLLNKDVITEEYAQAIQALVQVSEQALIMCEVTSDLEFRRSVDAQIKVAKWVKEGIR